MTNESRFGGRIGRIHYPPMKRERAFLLSTTNVTSFQKFGITTAIDLTPKSHSLILDKGPL